MAQVTRRRIAAVVIALVLAIATSLLVHVQNELRLASTRREQLSFGSDVVWHVMRDSFTGLDKNTNLSLESLSERDIFMLIQAAIYHIENDAELSVIDEPSRLPIRYSYLDGFNPDMLVLKRALVEDLVSAAPPNASNPSSWAVAPVLLGWQSSPDASRAVREVLADNPTLSIGTHGQITSERIITQNLRYALLGITEPAEERAAQLAEVQAAAHRIAAKAKESAAGDTYAYVREAFQLIANHAKYTQTDNSPHANDVYGALIERSARCYGLSGALKLVLDEAGIPNYLADGTAPQGRHTWNVVYLAGSWRVCDLTLMLTGGDDTGTATRERCCLVIQRNFYIEHNYIPDAECVVLQEVYEGVLKGLYYDTSAL